MFPILEIAACTAQIQKDCSPVDSNTIIQIILSVGLASLGWFARELWTAVKTLSRELTHLEITINRDYIRYDRMQDALKPIMTALEEIKHTLHTKMDKP